MGDALKKNVDALWTDEAADRKTMEELKTDVNQLKTEQGKLTLFQKQVETGMHYGGAYSVDVNHKCVLNNPRTKDCTCPRGYAGNRKLIASGYYFHACELNFASHGADRDHSNTSTKVLSEMV